MPVYLMIIIVGIFFLINPILHITLKNHIKIQKIISITVTCIYATLLFLVCMAKLSISDTFYMSFERYGDWFGKQFEFSLFSNIKDFIYNVAMMFPIGYCIALISKKTNKFKLLIATIVGLSFSLCIEFCQWLLPIARTPSLSDLLANTLSAFVGALIYVIINTILIKFSKKNNNINC